MQWVSAAQHAAAVLLLGTAMTGCTDFIGEPEYGVPTTGDVNPASTSTDPGTSAGVSTGANVDDGSGSSGGTTSGPGSTSSLGEPEYGVVLTEGPAEGTSSSGSEAGDPSGSTTGPLIEPDYGVGITE